MAWQTLRSRMLLLLHLLLLLVVAVVVEVRTQAPPVGVAGGAGAAAAGVPGAAAAGVPGAAAAGMMGTRTTQPKHQFCNTPPMPRAPKIPIFHMQVHTGFYNGYRSNQTVVVEIQAKYPETWRINQFFISVPHRNPMVYRNSPRGFIPPKHVGHWMWNVNPDKTMNTTTATGGSQPVDCGGMTSYGVFGMLSPTGAQAATQLENPSPDFKGYSKVEAKWVPPTDYRNILYRERITIEAYVTFEKTFPNAGGYGHSHYHYGHGQYHQHYYGTQPARWVKKTATLLNLDYIDMQNYLMFHYGPMGYQMLYGDLYTQPATMAPTPTEL